MALLTYPTGTTFAPGTYDWWKRTNYHGYIRNVASYMLTTLARPGVTYLASELHNIREGMQRPRLSAAYAGFILTSSNEINERNNSKMLLSGVVLGLIIIWIAPLVVQNLVGAASVCGW